MGAQSTAVNQTYLYMYMYMYMHACMCACKHTWMHATSNTNSAIHRGGAQYRSSRRTWFRISIEKVRCLGKYLCLISMLISREYRYRGLTFATCTGCGCLIVNRAERAKGKGVGRGGATTHLTDDEMLSIRVGSSLASAMAMSAHLRST